MVIDVHYHPAFIKEVCGDEELAERRRNDMAYYKTGVAEVERIKELMIGAIGDRNDDLVILYSVRQPEIR